VGKRAILMMLALLLITVYLMIYFTHNLYVPLAMMGVAFS
jgi:hypothetical protein